MKWRGSWDTRQVSRRRSRFAWFWVALVLGLAISHGAGAQPTPASNWQSLKSDLLTLKQRLQSSKEIIEQLSSDNARLAELLLQQQETLQRQESRLETLSLSLTESSLQLTTLNEHIEYLQRSRDRWRLGAFAGIPVSLAVGFAGGVAR